jgi:Tfp pilus assembly protein PilF
LGKCYVAQGKLQDALKVLLKAVELDANDKATHYQLAQLYAHLKQPDKSEYHMEIFRKLYEQERDKTFKRNQRAIQKALDRSSN